MAYLFGSWILLLVKYRYIFDAINDYGKVESVLLRDYSSVNVEQATFTY